MVEGDDLTILCPGSTMESDVHWERDGMDLDDPAGQVTARLVATTTKKPGLLQRWRERRRKLKALVRRRGRRHQPTARVDWTGALRLEAASVDESGLYSCGLVDGITALVADIRVVRRKAFTISDVSRHASYLLGVILLCLMVYLTVIAIACRLYPRYEQGYRPLQLSPDDDDRASDHDVKDSGDELASAATLVRRHTINFSSLEASICLTDERRSSSSTSSPSNVVTTADEAPAAKAPASSSIAGEADSAGSSLQLLLSPKAMASSSASAPTLSSTSTLLQSAEQARLEADGDGIRCTTSGTAVAESLPHDALQALAASICLVEDKTVSLEEPSA